MNRLADRFYNYKIGDVLLAKGDRPALLKVDDRCVGWDEGDILPHKYFHGKGIGLIRDDSFGRDDPKNFGLKYRLDSDQEPEGSCRWWRKRDLFLLRSEMFHEGVLEFAKEYFSKL